MQIKVHVTLQELKDFYIANTKGLPKDAELVVDEPVEPFMSDHITLGGAYPQTEGGACRPGCAVYHPPIVETPNYHTTESFGRQIQH